MSGGVSFPARRTIRAACDGCYRAKTRCSGGNPCERCSRADKPCTYSPTKPLGRPRADTYDSTPPSGLGIVLVSQSSVAGPRRPSSSPNFDDIGISSRSSHTTGPDNQQSSATADHDSQKPTDSRAATGRRNSRSHQTRDPGAYLASSSKAERVTEMNRTLLTDYRVGGGEAQPVQEEIEWLWDHLYVNRNRDGSVETPRRLSTPQGSCDCLNNYLLIQSHEAALLATTALDVAAFLQIAAHFDRTWKAYIRCSRCLALSEIRVLSVVLKCIDMLIKCLDVALSVPRTWQSPTNTFRPGMTTGRKLELITENLAQSLREFQLHPTFWLESEPVATPSSSSSRPTTQALQQARRLLSDLGRLKARE